MFILGFISSAGAIGTVSSTNCKSTSTDIYCENYKKNVIISCPMPTQNVIDYNNGTQIFSAGGAYYECGFNISGEYFAVYPRAYNATAFSTIPTGWLLYTGDTLTTLFQKANALGGIILNFISPLGFNILGYGIADITGIALVLIIGIYALIYLFIGAMMWKILSPFAGAG